MFTVGQTRKTQQLWTENRKVLFLKLTQAITWFHYNATFAKPLLATQPETQTSGAPFLAHRIAAKIQIFLPI